MKFIHLLSMPGQKVIALRVGKRSIHLAVRWSSTDGFRRVMLDACLLPLNPPSVEFLVRRAANSLESARSAVDRGVTK